MDPGSSHGGRCSDHDVFTRDDTYVSRGGRRQISKFAGGVGAVMLQEGETRGGEIDADEHRKSQTEGTQPKVDDGESRNSDLEVEEQP